MKAVEIQAMVEKKYFVDMKGPDIHSPETDIVLREQDIFDSFNIAEKDFLTKRYNDVKHNWTSQ